MNLTPKQLRIFEFIRQHRSHKGYSPTMQEIADSLGVTKVTVFEHVEALIKKGALVRDPNKSRSLSIADDAELPNEVPDRQINNDGPIPMPLQFPLVGKIAAGRPIEKCAQDETLRLEELFGPRRGAQPNAMFALQVDGWSMRDEGIFDGDYVIVERRETDVTGVLVIVIVVARAQHDGERHLRLIHRLLPGLRFGLDGLQEALGPVGNEVPALSGMRKDGDTERAVAVEIGPNMPLEGDEFGHDVPLLFLRAEFRRLAGPDPAHPVGIRPGPHHGQRGEKAMDIRQPHRPARRTAGFDIGHKRRELDEDLVGHGAEPFSS